MKLARKEVEKPWGRLAGSSKAGEHPIGEVWFAAPSGRGLPLLVKYIFTGEPLSVQVHPDDVQARRRGLPHGKDECWYIVDAEPGAAVALGLAERMEAEALRAAALDGSIMERLAWRPVGAGDFFYVPAGTLHAIGAGISLIEVQQPSDVTYRLYDYGRSRPLHLDEALAVARREPYPERFAVRASGALQTLVSSSHFTLLHILSAGREVPALADRDRWVIPLLGRVESARATGAAGECLFVPAGEPLKPSCGAAFLLAAVGAADAKPSAGYRRKAA